MLNQYKQYIYIYTYKTIKTANIKYKTGGIYRILNMEVLL